MKKLKIITCLLINLILFFLLISGLVETTNHKEIIKNNIPVRVKIIDINHRYKSRSTCDVEYNSKVYKRVSYPFNEDKIGSYNNIDFYYDKKKDIIFLKNEGSFALNVLIILFILSLLLWFIPSNKFKF